MPGPSQVSIINGALNHISKAPIVAITDTSPQALAAMRIWDSSLRETLRESFPGFATAVVALALHATYTPIHWSYAYMYPANCLAMSLVYNSGTTDPKIGEAFREVYHPTGNEKIILTNCESAYGEYIYLISDTTLFDASFVVALEYNLASKLAVPLTGDGAKAKSLIELYNIKKSECSRFNAYENQSSAQQTSVYKNAR